MGASATAGLTWSTALRLGRVSNLPTVWTNVLAGVVLAGGTLGSDARVALLLVALSMSYIAGMFLNDWFDRDIDARIRPDRPIPSGQVSSETVLTIGVALLAGSLLLLAWIGWRPLIAGAALAAAIIAYDWRHKNNPLSPLMMGMCRVLVYLVAGFSVAAVLPGPLWIGAALLLAYLIGLTYVAKQENLGEVKNLWPLLFLAVPIAFAGTMALRGPIQAVLFLAFAAWVAFALNYLRRRAPGDVPRAVVSLIAGISLLDAVLMASVGAHAPAILAVVGFGLTLLLQRFVSGT